MKKGRVYLFLYPAYILAYIPIALEQIRAYFRVYFYITIMYFCIMYRVILIYFCINWYFRVNSFFSYVDINLGIMFEIFFIAKSIYFILYPQINL